MKRFSNAIGVGFKSVFGVSKKVTIISGAYRFRFEEKHFEELKAKLPSDEFNPKIHYPWFSIPLWDNGPVPNEGVCIRLEEVVWSNVKTDCIGSDLLLFLRNVVSLRIKDSRKARDYNLSREYLKESLIARDGTCNIAYSYLTC